MIYNNRNNYAPIYSGLFLNSGGMRLLSWRCLGSDLGNRKEMQMSDLELAERLYGPSVKPMLSDWMTRAELAAELGLTTETLSRWDARRVGPAPTRVGRKVLYRRETVRAWLLAQEAARDAKARHAAPRRAGGRR